MPRNVLPESRIHPAVREKVASYRADFIGELEQAIATHEVVVIGMRQIGSGELSKSPRPS